MDNDELLIAIKDMFEKKTDDLKAYVDKKIDGQSILIESLKKDIKAVADRHNTLNEKIDDITKEIEVVENYVIGVDAKLNEHDVILKRVK